jgi:hypothetical protein
MKSEKLLGITIKLISISMLAVVSSLAFAGAVQTANVSVVINPDGSGTASGDMVTARTSDNEFDLIGCGIKGFKSGGPSEYGFCQAADSDDIYVTCGTTQKSLLDVMKAIGDYSYVRFDFDKNGQCTRLDFSTQSLYLPENVEGNPVP